MPADDCLRAKELWAWIEDRGLKGVGCCPNLLAHGLLRDYFFPMGC